MRMKEVAFRVGEERREKEKKKMYQQEEEEEQKAIVSSSKQRVPFQCWCVGLLELISNAHASNQPLTLTLTLP